MKAIGHLQHSTSTANVVYPTSAASLQFTSEEVTTLDVCGYLAV